MQNGTIHSYPPIKKGPEGLIIFGKFFFFNIYFIFLFWLPQVLVVARGIFSCGMWAS